MVVAVFAGAPQCIGTVEQSSEVNRQQLELVWGGRLILAQDVEPPHLQTGLAQASCRSPHPRVPPART